MPAPLLVGAVLIGGSIALSGVAAGVKNMNNGIERDTTKDIPASSLTPSVDTRAVRRDIEMIQHEIVSRPGVRVRVSGTIDSSDAIAQMQGLAGSSADIFDNRAPFSEGVVDDVLASRMR